MTKPSRRGRSPARVGECRSARRASSRGSRRADCPAPIRAAGTLVGTLPLSRAGAPVQPYGVKFGGRGLDARLVTDLSRLEPDRLITPNAAGVRPHRVPGRRRATPRALARQDNRSRSRRGIAHDRGAAEIGEAHGSAPVRVLRQQQPGKFRPDERGRVGRRTARRRALESSRWLSTPLPCSLAASITTPRNPAARLPVRAGSFRWPRSIVSAPFSPCG